MAGTLMLTAVAVTISSCSDDEKEYLADIYFTGSVPTVRVVGADASGTPASGIAAFSITFDAAAAWTLQAVDYMHQDQVADWVSFYTPAGGEGAQIIGVYTAANPSAQDRAAVVKATCNGRVISFTLIQQGNVAVQNPNADAIDENKQITEILYKEGETPKNGYVFSYDDNGVLSIMNAITYNGEEQEELTYTVTTDSREAAKGASVNKVNIEVSDLALAGQSFAVLNGKVLTGYDVLSVQPDMTDRLISFDYNAAMQLTAVDGFWFNGKYSWNSADLASMDFSGNSASGKVSATYSNQANDTNLDLVWFLGYGMDPSNQILGAMNLLGKRSANLPASVSGGNVTGTLTYTDGAVDLAGKNHKGLTVTCSGSNRVISIFFLEAAE